MNGHELLPSVLYLGVHQDSMSDHRSSRTRLPSAAGVYLGFFCSVLILLQAHLL